jgi:hypothetical protein
MDSGYRGRLRGYLLRLGAIVSLEESGSIVAYFPEGAVNDGEDLGGYVRNWATVNRATVRILDNGSDVS